MNASRTTTNDTTPASTPAQIACGIRSAKNSFIHRCRAAGAKLQSITANCTASSDIISELFAELSSARNKLAALEPAEVPEAAPATGDSGSTAQHQRCAIEKRARAVRAAQMRTKLRRDNMAAAAGALDLF
jgi:peptidoglycan hydrolase CwlO-like protein